MDLEDAPVEEKPKFCSHCEAEMWRLNGGWMCGRCDSGPGLPLPHWMDLGLCMACGFRGVHLVDGLCEGCAAEAARAAAEESTDG